MEKTQRFQQHKIKAEVDGASAQKIFTLRLDDLGPYPPIQSPTFPRSSTSLERRASVICIPP